MINNVLYDQWISFLFDRPDTEDAFYWNPADFPATDEQKALLIKQTFQRSGIDLASYTDTQVNNGLKYIFDVGLSDISTVLCQKGVAEEIRIESVLSIKQLYRDCFFKRCTKTLSHLNEPGSALNAICYMLWDISPLTK